MGMDPVTLSLIAAASAAGGTVYQGYTQNQMAKEQARMAEEAAVSQRLQNVMALRSRMATLNNLQAASQMGGASANALMAKTYEYGMLGTNNQYHSALAGARLTRYRGKTGLIGSVLTGAGQLAGGAGRAKQKQGG